MKYLKFFAYSMIAVIFAACSNNSSEENGVTENTAQNVLNGMKGTYTGSITIGNQPVTVKIVIDNEFTVKNLPLEPIYSHVFTEKEEIQKALDAISVAEFTAKHENIFFNNYQALLSMKQNDLILNMTVGEVQHRIIATIQTEAYKSMSFIGLSVNMRVSELNCDGKMIDLTREPINFFIDSAQKEETKQVTYETY